MLPEDTIPVISKIKTNRAGAIGFSINGVLASSDVENLYGLFEAEAEGFDHIDMIVIFKEYDGIDWESLFNEDTAKIRAEAFKKLRRYAIVGGPLPGSIWQLNFSGLSGVSKQNGLLPKILIKPGTISKQNLFDHIKHSTFTLFLTGGKKPVYP